MASLTSRYATSDACSRDDRETGRFAMSRKVIPVEVQRCSWDSFTPEPLPCRRGVEARRVWA